MITAIVIATSGPLDGEGRVLTEVFGFESMEAADEFATGYDAEDARVVDLTDPDSLDPLPA